MNYGWKKLGSVKEMSDEYWAMNSYAPMKRAAVRNRIGPLIGTDEEISEYYHNLLIADLDPSGGYEDDPWGSDGGEPVDELEGTGTYSDSGGPLFIQQRDAED